MIEVIICIACIHTIALSTLMKSFIVLYIRALSILINFLFAINRNGVHRNVRSKQMHDIVQLQIFTIVDEEALHTLLFKHLILNCITPTVGKFVIFFSLSQITK